MASGILMTSSTYDCKLVPLTYIAWCVLTVFLSISQGPNALFHILILIPGLYYTFRWFKENGQKVPQSAWGLLTFVFLVIISVLINNQENSPGLYPILGTLYFMGGIFAIAPTYQLFTSPYFTQRKKKRPFLLFFVSTTIAHLIGFGALFTNYSYFKEITCSTTRACGMHIETIAYAHCTQLLALLSWGLLINYKKINHLIGKHMLIISAVLSTIGLYFAESRGALLGLILALPLLFWKQGKKYILPLYGLGLAIIAAIILMIYLDYRPKFLGHYVTEFENKGSNMSRIYKYQAAYHGFKENPVWGLGFRTFKFYAHSLQKKYNIPDAPDYIGNAHNNYLEILFGCGIIGFLAFLAFQIFWLIEIFQSSSILISLFLPAYVAFSVSGIFLSTVESPEYMFFFMALYTLFQVMRLSIIEKNKPSAFHKTRV